jgi:hypothetical protein
MEDDEFIVAGSDNVLFQVVGPHGVGKGLGGQRMFRQMPGRAAVSDYDRPHLLNYFSYEP